ncbi:MAG: hypothetical protein EXS05_23190 [Planctomycetaceae bacterium]|nr:hypothetical protein [Planctomycetaceae bacterium]
MRFLSIGLLLCLLSGCAEKPRAALVPLEKIPENLMTIAKEKLPGVTFDQAVQHSDGRYEMSGKDGQGKVREIEVSPSGEVLDIE